MADIIETSFQAAIDANKINGAVICATDAEGRFIYNKALGQRTLLSGEKQPQQLDDVLFLASATKLLTTIAALQCVQDGLLTMTGDLTSIAPELAAKEVITGFSDDDDSPLLELSTRPITLEMLLCHSSGISYDFIHPHLVKWVQKFAPSRKDQRLPIEEAFSYPLVFHPGSAWMYGAGLDWAGRVVERVTGLKLGEYMQQRIFGPLGIADAQFYPVTREDLRARLVDLNPQDPEALGRAVFGVVGGGDQNKRVSGDCGGQGMFMSGIDYVKVLRSLLANDGKLLEPATVDDMFLNHLSPEATAGQQAVLDSPMAGFFRMGTAPKSKVGHGLGGLLTLQDVDGWYGERTLTWGGGVTSTWFIDRKNGLCGLGAVQAVLPIDGGDVVDALKQTFRRDIYRKHAAWKEE